jgi:hypothetical protein
MPAVILRVVPLAFAINACAVAHTAGRLEVAVIDGRLDGDFIQGVLLVEAKEADVLVDRNLIANRGLSVTKITRCGSPERLTALVVDTRRVEEPNNIELHVHEIFGRRFRISLTATGPPEDPLALGQIPECIEVWLSAGTLSEKSVSQPYRFERRSQ